MIITLTRTTFTDLSTIGNIIIDTNPFTCVTIENVDRGITQNTPVQDILRTKALYPKETASDVAIPYGTYEIAITWSNRFERLMPQIIHVPAFDGVRIHIANKPADVIGCVGVAKTCDPNIPNWIADSSFTFNNELYPILVDACAKEKVFITIQKSNTV